MRYHYVSGFQRNEDATASGFRAIKHERDCQVDGGHGRVEERQCWTVGDIGWLNRRNQWPGLQSTAMKVSFLAIALGGAPAPCTFVEGFLH